MESQELRAATDVIALMMVMVEQTSLDGHPDLGWLLTLQSDPPSGVFLDRQSGLKPFSSLADPKWIATMLAFIKEQDSLSARRSDLGKQKAPPPPKTDPKTGEPALCSFLGKAA